MYAAGLSVSGVVASSCVEGTELGADLENQKVGDRKDKS
jgi:hypothetical protein